MYESNNKLTEIIRRSKSNLIKWLRRDVAHLLDDLDSNNHIQRDVYIRVRDMANCTEKARTLVDHFIDSGEEECKNFLLSLRNVQRHFLVRLQKWLKSNKDVMETAMVLNASPVRATNAATQTDISSFDGDTVTLKGAEVLKSIENSIVDIVRKQISCYVKKEIEPVIQVVKKNQELLQDLTAKCANLHSVSGQSAPALRLEPRESAVLSDELTSPDENTFPNESSDCYPLQLENTEPPAALGRIFDLSSNSFSENVQSGAGHDSPDDAVNMPLQAISDRAADEQGRKRKQKAPTKRKHTGYLDPLKVKKSQKKIVCRL